MSHIIFLHTINWPSEAAYIVARFIPPPPPQDFVGMAMKEGVRFTTEMCVNVKYHHYTNLTFVRESGRSREAIRP